MWWESPQTLIARGLIALALGALLMLWPGMSLSMMWTIGLYAIAVGMLTIASAWVHSAPVLR